MVSKVEMVLAEINKMIAECGLTEIDNRIFGNINVGKVRFVTWGEAQINFKWLFGNAIVRFEQENNHLVIKELSVAGCGLREEQYHLESLLAYIRMTLKSDDRYQTLAHLKAHEINNHLNDINIILKRSYSSNLEELFHGIETKSINDTEAVVHSGDYLVCYTATETNLTVLQLHMNFQFNIKEGFIEYADAIIKTLIQIKQNLVGKENE